jgi:hypothetical protein
MGVYKLSTAGGLATPRTNYSSFLAGNPAVTPPSYESIATVTVGSGGAATATFSSIPSTYTHLQIRAIGRITGTDNKPIIQFNSDTTQTNYYQHALYGSGAGVGVWAYNNNWFSYWPETSTAANIFGIVVIDILDYANTNKNKTVRQLGGFDSNGSGYAWYNSLLWSNTNAITSITLKPNDSSNFAEYSQFALYGIKGS